MRQRIPLRGGYIRVNAACGFTPAAGVASGVQAIVVHAGSPRPLRRFTWLLMPSLKEQ